MYKGWQGGNALEHLWSMYALTALEEGIIPMRDAKGQVLPAGEVAQASRSDRKSRRKFRKIWRKEAKRRGIVNDVSPHDRMKLVDLHIYKKTVK